VNDQRPGGPTVIIGFMGRYDNLRLSPASPERLRFFGFFPNTTLLQENRSGKTIVAGRYPKFVFFRILFFRLADNPVM
jgi:hypothetical protein